MHGKTSMVHHNHFPLFKGFTSPFQAMRYHSLVLQDVKDTVLQTIAETEQGEVMAIAHPVYKICGIQFHPESILTPDGIRLLDNWLGWASLK
jgi:anthranilate/para-aminobenzoate synthase component II